ncbi:MAG: hypothetical protein WCQ32_00270 [bacterium]
MSYLIIDSQPGESKYDVLTKAFYNAISKDVRVQTLKGSVGIATPIYEDAFLPVIEGRIAIMKDLWQSRAEGSIFATIQKGFFDAAGFLFLSAMVGVEKDGILYTASTKSIPLTRVGGEILEKSEEVRYAEFGRLYPGFKQLGLVTIETDGETSEESWLEEATRECFEKLK